MIEKSILEILKIEDILSDAKVHLAKQQKGNRNIPLEIYNRDPKEFEIWSNGNDWGWFGKQINHFSKRYVIAFIYISKHTWLFVGVFEILDRKVVSVKKEEVISYLKQHGESTEKYDNYHDLIDFTNYKTKQTDMGKNLIGKLYIYYNKEGKRQQYLNAEKPIENMTWIEIKSEIPTIVYPKNPREIEIMHEDLKYVIESDDKHWKDLARWKGVYRITDIYNGKMYIGSAIGVENIWGRWSQYVSGNMEGHGNNKKLVELVKEKGIEYIQINFRYSIEQLYDMNEDDSVIYKKEQDMMRSLCTKEFGYNN